MKRSDFSYHLPQHLVAQYPLVRRTDSRLLHLEGQSGAISHHHFVDLPGFLRPDDLLVFNNTRVIPARLWGLKETGGRLEILIERITGSHSALAHIRSSKSPKPGTTILLCAAQEAEPCPHTLKVTAREGALFCLSSEGGLPLSEILQAIGHMPLPPYIKRVDEVEDQTRYQTVFAKREGAVAAPTAGLHFSEELLAQCDALNVGRTELTLHVGAGTFQPVRVEDITQHRMHSEYVEVNEQVCQAVREARARGGRVVAIGTTVMRSLESACLATGHVQPFRGNTDIFIYPGYQFQCVDALLTNFHLPESTLLMLVCAFGGATHVMAAYQQAIDAQYRFFSYGDAMFLTHRPESSGTP
ncbi:MAG: tRNA preQ1(34) S-adenosylmethionine ribosyltransferase-isomerase QueA [Halieaceae bacterium]|jgi:S-adenosylmethionine:tRNA ribosyltransferase-isomerase|nr:tRNA preQ1(34) S-adenosylmethionine ribosyltransferase-isomerase QueA [Halieaceae bacterium]